jgi:formylglycine-generating enzyme required for sulfatase activity
MRIVTSLFIAVVLFGAAARGEPNAARVIRGGSWLDSPDFQRAAKRIVFPPQGRRDFIGFRVALNIESAK